MTAAANPHDLTNDDIVLSHFTLGRHHDIRQRIDAAAGAGCQAIGLYIRDYQRLEAEGDADRLGGLLAGRGLALAEIDALRSWVEPASGRTADDLDQEAAAFRIAARFGCRSLHVLGPKAGDLDDCVGAFGALCDRAADVGVLVALEFLPTTIVGSAADALRVVEAADRGNGGVCVDVWHHERGAGDLDLIRMLPGDRVIDVQMSDGPLTPVLGDYEEDTRRTRLPPDDGEFDLAGFVAAVQATGANVPWSLEVCQEDAWETDGAAFVARCVEGLRRVLAAGFDAR